MNVEIKKISTDEENVIHRNITFDVYVEGEYDRTFDDAVEAMDYRDQRIAKAEAAPEPERPDPRESSGRGWIALEESAGGELTRAQAEAVARALCPGRAMGSYPLRAFDPENGDFEITEIDQTDWNIALARGLRDAEPEPDDDDEEPTPAPEPHTSPCAVCGESPAAEVFSYGEPRRGWPVGGYCAACAARRLAVDPEAAHEPAPAHEPPDLE